MTNRGHGWTVRNRARGTGRPCMDSYEGRQRRRGGLSCPCRPVGAGQRTLQREEKQVPSSACRSSWPEKTSGRLPMSSEMSSSGARHKRLDQRRPDVVADRRHGADAQRRPPARRGLLRLARVVLEQPRAPLSRMARTQAPAMVVRRPRPSGSSSLPLTSRSSAETAADTDGCVTNSSSAAAVDLRRTTVTTPTR